MLQDAFVTFRVTFCPLTRMFEIIASQGVGGAASALPLAHAVAHRLPPLALEEAWNASLRRSGLQAAVPAAALGCAVPAPTATMTQSATGYGTYGYAGLAMAR